MHPHHWVLRWRKQVTDVSIHALQCSGAWTLLKEAALRKIRKTGKNCVHGIIMYCVVSCPLPSNFLLQLVKSKTLNIIIFYLIGIVLMSENFCWNWPGKIFKTQGIPVLNFHGHPISLVIQISKIYSYWKSHIFNWFFLQEHVGADSFENLKEFPSYYAGN